MKRILLSLTMVLAFLIGCERSGYEFDHGHDEGLPNGNVTVSVATIKAFIRPAPRRMPSVTNFAEMTI